MKRCKTLGLFCREVMRLVGCGYVYANFVKIKEMSEDKINEKIHYIDTIYELDKTRSAKAWNRHKDIANVDAVFFEKYNVLFIAKTKGALHKNLTDKGVKDYQFEKVEKLTLQISALLGLKLYKQVTTKEAKEKAIQQGKAPKVERWTFKLSYETFKAFKAEFYNAISKGDGRHFHTLQSRWKGLPNYVGIGIQRTNLNTFIQDLMKKHARHWSKTF